MKNLLKSLAVAVVAGVLCLTVPVAAQAKTNYTNQADIDIMTEMDESIQKFSEELSSETATKESIHLQGGKTTAVLKRVQEHSFSKDVNSEYLAAAEKIKVLAGRSEESIKKFLATLYSNDEMAITNTLQTMGEEFTEISKEMEAVDAEMASAIEASNSKVSNFYLVILAITAVISVASFIWSYRAKELTEDLDKARKAVALSSLAPLTGAAITSGTIAFADQLGGTYYAMYGLIIFGAVYYFASIGNYRRIKKEARIPSGEAANPSNTPQPSIK